VAACSEKPALLASNGLFGASSSGGRLNRVSALRPACGPIPVAANKKPTSRLAFYFKANAS